MSEENTAARDLSDVFILLGIPGLEAAHFWISIPLCSMYLIALCGNTRASRDIAGANSTTVPKMLLLLWFKAREISFTACLTQMFFVQAVFALESAILLAMASDRYVAVCHPLRYTAVVTQAVAGRIGVASTLRSLCVGLPLLWFLKRLPYCGHHIVHHTYCEHMGIARLACADITVTTVYGSIVTFLAVGLDVIFITVSYALILRAAFRLPSKDARLKDLRTCSSHLCLMLIFYTPAFFSFLSHCFGHNVPLHIHILLANLYMLVPPTPNPIIYRVKTQLIRARVLKTFNPQRRSP
uniref:G-protein coupled receptors family 1 profile domain-containing protein n=1 Tax=Chelonoidis abingdonii TaxID=106734 RepID=A0A8C0GGW7_CHEAB